MESGGGGTGGVGVGAAAAAHYNPRTVEEVFRDFKGRRAALIKALTTGFSLSLSLTFFSSCVFRLRYYCRFERYGMSFSLLRECASSLSFRFLCCCCCELRNRKRFFFV